MNVMEVNDWYGLRDPRKQRVVFDACNFVVCTSSIYLLENKRLIVEEAQRQEG